MFNLNPTQDYAHDETPGLNLEKPKILAEPKNTQDVQDIIKYAREHNLILVPRGAGSGKAGGCSVVFKNSLVIDFSKFNKIINISPDNLTARVQPGVLLGDLKSYLDKLNLFYPPDPSSWPICTIGGTVSTNAAGPSSLKYGCTRDYVLGLEIITAQGEILKLGKQTVKGVAGYDLVSLICGSEGTLALMTEITLKLLPKPQFTKTALLEFDSNTQAILAINNILSSGYLPRTLEYLDKSCLEYKNSALILEFDGNHEEALLEELSACIHITHAKSIKIALNNKQRENIWAKRRLMSQNLKARKKHKISEDIAVPRSKILDFIGEFEKLEDKYLVETAIFGHAGDGNLHAQVLFDQDLSNKTRLNILQEICEISLKLDGTISGEHGIGLAKKEFLKLEQSKSVIALQKSIKKIFDPDGILNPAKIFD